MGRDQGLHRGFETGFSHPISRGLSSQTPAVPLPVGCLSDPDATTSQPRSPTRLTLAVLRDTYFLHVT